MVSKIVNLDDFVAPLSFLDRIMGWAFFVQPWPSDSLGDQTGGLLAAVWALVASDLSRCLVPHIWPALLASRLVERHPPPNKWAIFLGRPQRVDRFMRQPESYITRAQNQTHGPMGRSGLKIIQRG